MTQVAPQYRWTREEFLRAWEAGVFEHRVELVEGEVWPVVIGDWHGRTTKRAIRLLPETGAEVMTSTLPATGSLPDPDCWMLRDGATAVRKVSQRLSEWSPADVLLVVEVSDDTVALDLGVKARLYAGAGHPVYWVVTPEGIYEHTEPSPSGYGLIAVHRRGATVAVRYAGTELAVDDLIDPGPGPTRP